MPKTIFLALMKLMISVPVVSGSSKHPRRCLYMPGWVSLRSRCLCCSLHLQCPPPIYILPVFQRPAPSWSLLLLLWCLSCKTYSSAVQNEIISLVNCCQVPPYHHPNEIIISRRYGQCLRSVPHGTKLRSFSLHAPWLMPNGVAISIKEVVFWLSESWVFFN